MYRWQMYVHGDCKEGQQWRASMERICDCDGKADVLVRIYRYDPTGIRTYKIIAKKGKDGTHLWEESVSGKYAYMEAYPVPDLDCDGKADVIVRMRTSYNPTTYVSTWKLIAKKGKDGTHLWEESVTGTYDDKADVLVSSHRYDPDTNTYTYTVIAKKGKDGTHLWEESVSGKNAYLYADLVPDLDCDGKPDFLVHQRTCRDDICTYTVIAKRGKDGKHLWEESVSGTYAYMDAIPIKDMDCDDKPDILVYQQRYDPETERYHYKIIAKKGKDGTHLLWGESDEYIQVAWPCWWWEPYPDVDETSVQASAFNQSTENIIPVPELFGYDLDCDGKSDLLISTSNMMYALTAKRPENAVYFKPQQSSACYCSTVEVEIWVNATNLGSGQINLTYNPDSAYRRLHGWHTDDPLCK